MRIRNVRRLTMPPGRRGFTPLCRFDLEPIDGVVIMNCSLVRAPDGRIFVYGPAGNGGTTTVNLAPDVRRHVIDEALDAMGMDSDDRAAA
ncbi:hypothetical protein EV667_1989 [Ancylobacter aquaticus]|uniref:Uncharacterized protein n=1 Tax=Ancylobacter aquaticus TaxID=100 RepID=A0A4R1I239_ANCAQ|nr:hypothetical protein [Ancylobacter aquaticus]TCK27993.1 hypothetical protein EV667_1989 [Ancylobacter aquaticus]